MFLLFLVFLGGLSAFLIVQKLQFGRFQSNFIQLSRQHVSLIDALQKAQVSLFVYHDSIRQWFQTNDAKWGPVAADAKQVYKTEMSKLESSLLRGKKGSIQKEGVAKSEEAINKLEKNLEKWRILSNKDQLVPQLLEGTIAVSSIYFEQVSKKIALHSARDSFDPKIKLNSESDILGVIFSAFAAVNESLLHSSLGALSRQIGLLPKIQERSILYVGIGGGIVLFIYIILVFQVLSFARKSESRNEMLVQMGTRDLVTGLLNRRVFEGLVGQEIERAKRKGYSVSVLFIQVEPLHQIVHDFGRPAAEHLLFQISEFLRKVCRTYDGIFSYDREIFAVILSEANAGNVTIVRDRLKKKIESKDFFIGLSNDIIKPHLKFGSATYPKNGEDLKAVIQLGLNNLYKGEPHQDSESLRAVEV